jgi:hypothetical protein
MTPILVKDTYKEEHSPLEFERGLSDKSICTCVCPVYVTNITHLGGMYVYIKLSKLSICIFDEYGTLSLSGLSPKIRQSRARNYNRAKTIGLQD